MPEMKKNLPLDSNKMLKKKVPQKKKAIEMHISFYFEEFSTHEKLKICTFSS